MARRKHRATPPSAAAEKSDNRRHLSMERSAYFARREAAKVLKLVLQGDAKRQSVGSIKTLVYGPSVRNKKGTFALICQTLKCKFTTLAKFRNAHIFIASVLFGRREN